MKPIVYKTFLPPFWCAVEVEEDVDTDIDILLEEILREADGHGNLAELVVYNDDFNTFNWVIKCFIEVLEHTPEQSEQLALIIHYKGKAIVKTASKRVLQPKKDALVERGLSAVIEGGSDDND
ncbi:MAG: ATP-dependent Clp protease adaptor ClpS [Saprospiraceae bacterium]|nr:ATP-dependent Clp protease adaptor ClpS [Saprospiraceae bacterium]